MPKVLEYRLLRRADLSSLDSGWDKWSPIELADGSEIMLCQRIAWAEDPKARELQAVAQARSQFIGAAVDVADNERKAALFIALHDALLEARKVQP